MRIAPRTPFKPRDPPRLPGDVAAARDALVVPLAGFPCGMGLAGLFAVAAR